MWARTRGGRDGKEEEVVVNGFGSEDMAGREVAEDEVELTESLKESKGLLRCEAAEPKV